MVKLFKCKTALVVIITVFSAAPAAADSFLKWNRDRISGFERYWTTNPEGSSFVVWCHPKRSDNGTVFHVEIDGNTPQPGSRMKFVLDNDIFEVPINGQGYIASACATCSDSFHYIWHGLRSAVSMAVKFKDKSYAGFSLKGAKEILPAKVCPTDWEKKNP